MKNFAFVPFACIALAGCPETVPACPGMPGFVENPDGECVPDPVDSGLDASVGDAGERTDAGPCGGCGEGFFCLETADGFRCVQCDDDGDCELPLLCDEESNRCVECIVDADCPDRTSSQCVDGGCIGCADSTHCEHFEDTPACAVGQGCVVCTPTESDACGGNPCRPNHTCSNFSGTQRPCEPCDTDSNCGAAPDHYCVPMTYDGRAHGNFCLKNQNATGGCDTRPFRNSIGATSVDGEPGPYCGINDMLATCEAVRALLDDMPCGTDEDCPLSGRCETVEGSPLHCTYSCVGDAECPLGVGDRCGVGTVPSPPSYCGG